MKATKPETWEERFFKKFSNHTNEFINPWKISERHEVLAELQDELMAFIRTELTRARKESYAKGWNDGQQALTSTREELVKAVEGMRKWYETGTPMNPDYDDAYNQALTDVITLLQRHETNN